ncbi:MAG TPA: FAD-dependent oxidoreductase [Pseudonocardiaceae bacterium]
MKIAVVGAGVSGLSTTAALLDRDADVVCYESTGPMSQRSAGASRIFRLAHGAPELVELAERSLHEFRAWSARLGAELVRTTGTAVTGECVPEWAAAMAAAGAAHRVAEATPELLGTEVRAIDGPALVDLGGGVLDAEAVGRYLFGRARSAVVHDPVFRLERTAAGRARVHSVSGTQDFDACVLVAGAGSSHLGADVGLYVPAGLYHHARFTFPLLDGGARPVCLIEKSQAWRPGVTTYQHLVAPGQWAVGTHFDPADSAWELGRDHVVGTGRRLTLEYVRENLPGVDEQVLDELYCTITASWGDGYGAQREGPFLTLYGDNLFKLAPVIGTVLAEAALCDDAPKPVLHG